MLTPSWKVEIVELINKQNNLTLSESDIEFAIVTRTDGALDVKVTPAVGSPYFNEQTVTYVPRDLAKAFLGLPLRIIVNADTTIRALVETLSTRYGIPFDTAVDFAQAELDKVVSFSESGQQDVEIPAGSDSFVWIGKLTVHVANDALDLATIIANTNMTSLQYITQDENVSAVEFATMALDWSKQATDYGFDNLTAGMKLLDVHVPEIVARMIDESIVPESARSELETLIASVGFKETVDVGDGMKVAKFNSLMIPDSTWGGAPHFYYATQPVAAIDINKFFQQEYSIMDLHAELGYGVYGIRHGDVAGVYLGDMDAQASYTYVALPMARRWLNQDFRTDAEKAEMSQLLSRWKSNVEISGELTDDWSKNTIVIAGTKQLSGGLSWTTDGMPTADDDSQANLNMAIPELTTTVLGDSGVINNIAGWGAGGSGIMAFNSLYTFSNGKIVPRSDLTITPPTSETQEQSYGTVHRPGGRRIWSFDKTGGTTTDLSSFGDAGVVTLSMSAVIAARDYDTSGVAAVLYPVWTTDGIQQAKEGVSGAPESMGFGQLEYAIGTAIAAKPDMFGFTAETAEAFHSFISMLSSNIDSERTISRSVELVGGKLAVIYRPAGMLNQFTNELKIVFSDITGIPDIAAYFATKNSFTIRNADDFQQIIDSIENNNLTMNNFVQPIFNESQVTSWTDYLGVITAICGKYSNENQQMMLVPVEVTNVDGKRIVTTTAGLMPGYKLIEG